MVDHNILKGYADGTFRPDNPITRAEFIAVCTRFDTLSASEAMVAFSDVSENDWFYDEVMFAASRGWIQGRDDGKFYPDDFITRSEVVTVVNGMLRRVADSAYVDDAVNTSVEDFVVYSDLAPNHWAYYEIYEASVSHDYETDDEGNEVKWRNHRAKN